MEFGRKFVLKLLPCLVSDFTLICWWGEIRINCYLQEARWIFHPNTIAILSLTGSQLSEPFYLNVVYVESRFSIARALTLNTIEICLRNSNFTPFVVILCNHTWSPLHFWWGCSAAAVLNRRYFSFESSTSNETPECRQSQFLKH